MTSPSYNVVYVVSAGLNRNGRPLPHLINRINEAVRMKNKDEVQRILIGNRNDYLTSSMMRYLIEELEMFPEYISSINGGTGTAGEMLHGRKIIEKMITKKDIPSNVNFSVLTTDWALERTNIISDWILSFYEHNVIGVPDGRLEWVKEKIQRMRLQHEITEEKAEEWIKTVEKEIDHDAYLEKMKTDVYRFIPKTSLLAENGKLLSFLEGSLSFIIHPLSLGFPYLGEYLKPLYGKNSYQISKGIYD